MPPALEERLPALFPDIALRRTRTLFLIHESTQHLGAVGAGPDSLILTPISREILCSGSLANSDRVRDEICWMWPSEERFYQEGFGIVAVLDGEIICWCTAEYVGHNCCGIGIETMPSYEGRGVATATTLRFVRFAQERGITACWECAAANRGSVRVAEKAGFLLASEESYWIGTLEQSGVQ